MLMLLILLPPLLFLILLKKLVLFRTTKLMLPPGPNTWQVIRKLSEFRKRPHIAFTDLAKTYGPLMSFRLGSQVVIVASSASTAREILQTQDRNFSGRFLPWIYYKVPGAEQSSLALSKECNDTWRFLRGISQNFIFSSKSVDSRADMRKAKVVELVRYLMSRQGQTVQLDDLMNWTIYNIISHILVSRDLFDITSDRDDKESVRVLVDEIIGMISSSLGLSDLFPIMRPMLDFGTERQATEIYRKIVYIWEDMVQERISERRDDHRLANAATSSTPPARDFLDVLIDNALPDDRICMVIMELLAAGMDSSSITSTWMMVELIRNPEMMRRVVDEIEGAFEGDMVIKESVLSESEYLQACIKETLRLHIPGPLLVPHRAIETCKIEKYAIPKDSMVVVNGWAISMDPESWKDPERFDPDRFVRDPNIDFRGTHFEYIPFGAGRRMCPGFNLAFKNVQIVVASLLHYFDWTLPGGADPAQMDTADRFGTVLKKETPLLLIPSFRE